MQDEAPPLQQQQQQQQQQLRWTDNDTLLALNLYAASIDDNNMVPNFPLVLLDQHEEEQFVPIRPKVLSREQGQPKGPNKEWRRLDNLKDRQLMLTTM
jgi:hypothetical protein